MKMIGPRAQIIRPPVDPIQQAYSLLAPLTDHLEASLTETYQTTVDLIPEVSRHLIDSGGKRIRPILLMLAARAVDAEVEQGLGLAVASELLHNATLLHDDVVDRGELRRGVASAPIIYGNAASVLVGDFLLSKALGLVVSHGDLDLLNAYADMLAAMAEGEVLQLLRSGRLHVSLPEYVEIISGKTAGLFSWCCRAGASLAPSTELAPAQAARFGKAFGMAFQVTDDILDYTAPPEHSGKDVANDLLQGKATLPLLLACIDDQDLKRLVERTAQSGHPSPEVCQTIVKRVLQSSATHQSLTEARRYASLAKGELAAFPVGPAVETLAALVDSIIDRVVLA